MVSAPVKVKGYREYRKDGTMDVNLHRGQQSVMLSKARFPVILAGTQVGKTIYIPDWLMREMDTRGEGDYLAGTSTYPLLNLKLLPVMLDLFCNTKFNGNYWGKYRDSDKMIISRDEKTRIIFFSAVNPESIESATAKGAIWDECGQKECKLQTWEAVQRRLSIHQGRCLLATTIYQLGWLKSEVYDRWKAGDKNFEIFQFDSTMNPAFPKEEFERMRAIMPAWKFDMFYRGRFTKPAGLVYDSFDDVNCIIDRFEIPREWPIYVGHDFGTANPAALFFARALDDDLNPPNGKNKRYSKGDLIAFCEYLPGAGKSTFDQVQEFKRITAGRNVISRVGGNITSEEGWRNDYTSQGWPITPPKWKDVDVQIARTYAMHSLNSIKMFRDLSHLVDETTSFSYVLDDKYNSTDKYDSESTFHLLACKRYICSSFVSETIFQNTPVKPRSYI